MYETGENVTDLRLDSPFKSLLEYSMNYKDIDTMDSFKRTHIPFPVILLNTMNEFKKDVKFT